MKSGIKLIIVGLALGLVTGICFLLLLGAAVGIGMGGGLKNPDAVIRAFLSAAGVSLFLVISGIYLNIIRRSQRNASETTAVINTKPNNTHMATPKNPND